MMSIAGILFFTAMRMIAMENDPEKHIRHGFYLENIETTGKIPVRVSSVSIKRDEYQLEKANYIVIQDKLKPLAAIVAKTATYEDYREIPAVVGELYKGTDSNWAVVHAVCLKVEHLLSPEIYRYIWLQKFHIKKGEAYLKGQISGGFPFRKLSEDFTFGPDRKSRTLVKLFIDEADLSNMAVVTTTTACD